MFFNLRSQGRLYDCAQSDPRNARLMVCGGALVDEKRFSL